MIDPAIVSQESLASNLFQNWVNLVAKIMLLSLGLLSRLVVATSIFSKVIQ